MGVMYFNGQGAPRGLVRARRLFEEARQSEVAEVSSQAEANLRLFK